MRDQGGVVNQEIEGDYCQQYNTQHNECGGKDSLE
jgi:hypothetical protein